MSSAEIAVAALRRGSFDDCTIEAMLPARHADSSVWRELVEHYGSAVAAVQALIFSEAP